MKRVFILLVVFVLAISVAACGDAPTEKKPAATQIENDLNFYLLEYGNNIANNDLTLVSYQIEKSLTQDNTYFAEVIVNAETKYTDLNLTATMSYTLYDQGWDIDSCNWKANSCELVRYPTDSDIQSLGDGYIGLIDNQAPQVIVEIQNYTLSFDGEQFYISGTAEDNISTYASCIDYVKHIYEYNYSTGLWDYIECIIENEIVQPNERFENEWTRLIDTDITIVSIDNTGIDVIIETDRVKTECIHLEYCEEYSGKGYSSEYNGDLLYLEYNNSDVEFLSKESNTYSTAELSLGFYLFEALQVDNAVSFDMCCQWELRQLNSISPESYRIIEDGVAYHTVS